MAWRITTGNCNNNLNNNSQKVAGVRGHLQGVIPSRLAG